jgi:G6PDH family F420-dependent oxidoreductase
VALPITRQLCAGAPHASRAPHFSVEDARLYDLPEPAPPIVVAAGGRRAAGLAAECAGGLIATEPRAELVDAFVEAGGSGPRYAEVALCWAPREDQARDLAHRFSRWSGLGWSVLPELADPEAFAAATRSVRPEDLEESIALGPDVESHVERIRPYVDAGFDHLILLQIGPEQKGFLEFYERELSPALGRTFGNGTGGSHADAEAR